MLTQASPCRERWRFGRGDGAASAWLYLFNLRIDDEDLRRLPLVERREHLAEPLADAGSALHIDGDGAPIFAHASMEIGSSGMRPI